MKLILYAHDGMVGEVTLNPFEYSYNGPADGVEEYLDTEPNPQFIEGGGEVGTDQSSPQTYRSPTDQERLELIGMKVRDLGVWDVEIVDG